MKTTITVFT